MALKSPYGNAGMSIDELIERTYMPSKSQSTGGRFRITKMTPSALDTMGQVAQYAGMGAQGAQSGSYTQGIAGGAMAGATAGSVFGPVGTAVGGFAGGLIGGIGTAINKKKKPKVDPLVTENMRLQNEMMRSSLIDKQNDRDWMTKFRRAARYR
jgi:hypothetical protein